MSSFKINPKHKGWCTPMTKSTCTGKRRTFALNAKHHFKKWKKGENGLEILPQDYAVGALSAIDMLIPRDEAQQMVVRPQEIEAIQPTGSGALLRKGGKIKKYKFGGEEKGKKGAIDNNVRKDWNSYVDYLRTKKVAGDPSLDTSGLGFKYLDEYIKANPSTSLNKDVILPIQQDLQQYRDYSLGRIKSGKGVFAKGVDETNFMSNLSKVDGYPGQYTTSYKFPMEYMRYVDESKGTDTTINKGYATAKPFENGGKATFQSKNYKNGGNISPEKAREMLHNPPHGKPLTDKQRKYFGYLSNKKAKNGMKVLDDNTVEFVGDSHSDPSGGIPMAAYGKHVMVEGGETAQMSPIDNSLTIMGNLKNPLTGRKYKTDSKILADKQMKTEKYIDEGTQLVNENSPADKWQSLKFNSGRAMMGGGEFKKKQILAAKEHLANMQDAHLELISPDYAEAKYGMKMAAFGDSYDNPIDYKGRVRQRIRASARGQITPVNNTLLSPPSAPISPFTGSPSLQMDTEPNAARALNVDNSISPIERNVPSSAMTRTSGSLNVPSSTNPTAYAFSNARRLSATQILPELYTAATNKLEGVHAQSYSPDLLQPYQISLQDKRNAANSIFRASTQYLGDNPAAQAQLAAQTYGQINDVNAEEFRTNQGISNDIINKNSQLLNEAKSANLSIADTQFTRQQQAKSNTKTQNRVVLQSITDKMKQNQLEQQQIKLYENLYNFRFDPTTGKAISFNPQEDFDVNVPGTSYVPSTSPSEQRVTQTVKQGNTTTRTTTDPYSLTVGRQYENVNKKFKADNTRLKYASMFK